MTPGTRRNRRKSFVVRHSCQVEGIVTSGNEVPLSAGNQRSASAMSVPQSTIDPVVAAGAAAAEKDVSSRRKHWSEEEAPTTAAEPYFARIFADLSAQSDVTPYPVIHGQPVTILQCRFQAHIAGVTTAAEAATVSKDLSENISREACFSISVCPYAYRLAPPSSRAEDSQIEENERWSSLSSDGSSKTCGTRGKRKTEGSCDNGDVGSGEKLLYLLQKWNIWNTVLAVTRIDGGFVQAEILGIRRYKFVVDRANRVLESSHLGSLRRAVDIDLNPTLAISRNKSNAVKPNKPHLPDNQHGPEGWAVDIRIRRRGDPRVGPEAAAEDEWDRFVKASSVSQENAEMNGSGGSVDKERPKALPGFGSESVTGADTQSCSSGRVSCAVSPCSSDQPRQESVKRRGRSIARVPGNGINNVPSTEVKNGREEKRRDRRLVNSDLDSSICRGYSRRALSLAQLNISSETVEFPAGHVPCVMGTKGYGKKRGRVNYFAVRTSPLTTSLHPCLDKLREAEDTENTTACCISDVLNSPSLIPSIPAPPNMIPDWICALEKDPTSATNCPGQLGGVAASRRGEDGSGSRWSSSYSTHGEVLCHEISTNTGTSASRVSSSGTLNSPSRVSAIVHGVSSGVHRDHDPLHPPPIINHPYSHPDAISRGGGKGKSGRARRGGETPVASAGVGAGVCITSALHSRYGKNNTLVAPATTISSNDKQTQGSLWSHASSSTLAHTCGEENSVPLTTATAREIIGEKCYAEPMIRRDVSHDAWRSGAPAPLSSKQQSARVVFAENTPSGGGGNTAIEGDPEQRRRRGETGTGFTSAGVAHHEHRGDGRKGCKSAGTNDVGGTARSIPTSVRGWRDDPSISTTSDSGMDGIVAPSRNAEGHRQSDVNNGARVAAGHVRGDASGGQDGEVFAGQDAIGSFENSNRPSRCASPDGDLWNSDSCGHVGSPASALGPITPRRPMLLGEVGCENVSYVGGSTGDVRAWTPALPVEHDPRPPPSV